MPANFFEVMQNLWKYPRSFLLSYTPTMEALKVSEIGKLLPVILRIVIIDL